ncbi:MAG: serine/threonine-protein phosphatase [Bryobacterales bacterium]|nr:serine/threonine-protein phosphatase [Bryobacterales bacterium]
MQPLLGDDVMLLIMGTVIATIGLAAIVVHVFRWRPGERVLLWLGLFAVPYGLSLIVKTSPFQPGFGRQRSLWLFGERAIELSMTVPALLLFEEFYGRGWRSSIRWLIGSYVFFAIILFAMMVRQNQPELIPAPGTGMVILVPAVLLLGRVAGYHPPSLPHKRVLFGGLLVFFVAFSRDHLLTARAGVWRPGLEPYGFLVLVFCLGYVAAKRLVADERQLVSFADEMRAAARIQASILPRTTPSMDNLQIAVRYAPMTAVAGDLYDFIAIPPGRVGILVADVAGHGVPAALVASMVKVAVSTQWGREGEPAKVIEGLNSVLCREARGQYVTAVYLCVDETTRTGRYSAAAHPPPLVWRRGTQTLHELDTPGLLLGVRPNEVYSEEEFTLEAGDRLLLYTDGLVEAENNAGQSFGEVMLTRFIEVHQHLGTEPFADKLLKEVLAWSSGNGQESQADDITLVVIDVKEK